MRECLNSLFHFDVTTGSLENIKTKGISVLPRKNHCAALYGNYMFVYGGLLDSGHVCSEAIALHLETLEWRRQVMKSDAPEPFAYGGS